MLKKVLFTLLWITLLLMLAFACWAVVVLLDWPLWYLPLAFAGVLLGMELAVWMSRRWHNWRLRRRMQANLPEREPESIPDIDRSWASGMQLLRQSRLGRIGGGLYTLPWFLMLGDAGAGKTTLATRSGLATPLRPVGRTEAVEATSTLNWWFFEHGVLLDVAGRLLDDDRAWKRMLYWLLRSRRREPLNGVLLIVDISSLQENDRERLTTLGHRLRRQLDDLVKVFGARLPIYLILTGGERLTGCRDWGTSLTDEQREQPFGLIARVRDEGARAFLDDIFDGLGRRLAELRVELGQRSLPSAEVLHFPERVVALRPALEKLLLPAFDSNPYSEPPLLAGLFITVETADEQGTPDGWFSRDLFDRLLPTQRYAYRPIDSWRHWRRLMMHAMVVLWLAACAGAAVVLCYAADHVRDGLNMAEQQRPAAASFLQGLDRDLEALKRNHQYVDNLDAYANHSWQRWLPFHGRLDRFLAYARQSYVDTFIEQIQRPLFDGILADQLPIAANSNDDRLIAAYTELLVRRINLIDARLTGLPLEGRPGPGDELRPLFRRFFPDQVPSATHAQSLSDSYEHYLEWQTDEQRLRGERASAAHQLDGLGLSERPLSWLVTWAEQQTDLPEVRYSDYMQASDQPDMALPRAFTAEGQHAIHAFVDELIAATRGETLWNSQREHFLAEYRQDSLNAWYRFIEGFLLVDQQRMASQTEWRQILSEIATPDDPYRKLLHRAAQSFALIPQDKRGHWADLAVRLDRLLTLADDDAARDDEGLLARLRNANQIGSDALKGMVGSGSITQGMNDLHGDAAQARILAQFEAKLRAVVADLQKSDAQAFKVAQDNWAFGSDPAITSATLWEAQALRDELRAQYQAHDSRESAIWTLATGGLDFIMAYAGEIAACTLQQNWNGDVLGAIEGVRDPVLLNELLYGDQGALSQFLAGPIEPFIQRNADGYTARTALDQQIPLRQSFYLYASRMQHAHSRLASAERRSNALQAQQQANRQTLEARQTALQTQLTALQQQLPKLLAGTTVVEIHAAPPSINPEARQLPQQTRLTMQCSNQPSVLDNYNFPTSASFVWTPDTCRDVNLEIRFPDFTLSKRWSGGRGFIAFLRAFSGGQRTLTPDDFPNQRELMASESISALTLTYRQQGGDALLQHYRQADELEAQADTLEAELKDIGERLAAMDAQSRGAAVNEAKTGSPAEQRIAAMPPPPDIAWCWTAPPSRPAGDVSTRYAVDVGVFSDPTRVEHLRHQLDVMGFQTRQETLDDGRSRVVIIDLDSVAAQQRAIESVEQRLDVKPGSLSGVTDRRENTGS